MSNRLDLGKEKPLKLFYSFVWPAILGMLAINTAGLVDSYFMGNYIGADAIGAITLIMPILSILAGVAVMIEAGGVVLAGIEYGKKNYEKSNNIFNQTFFLILITAIIMAIVLRFSLKAITIDILGLSGDISRYIFDYFYTMLFFLVPFMLVSFFSFFLKLDSMPNLAVGVTLIGVVINIVLDYLFVGVLAFGMKGAALATGISQVIPAFIFLIVTIKKSMWKFQLPKFNISEVKMIFFNGSSELLGLGAVGIAGYIYNIIIAKSMGIDGVSAYGVAMQISIIAIMIYYGISDSIQSIVSYNFGAKLYKRVDTFRKIAFLSSFIFGIIICAVLILFGDKIAHIFVKDQNIIDMSANIMIYYGISLVFAGINLNASTYYTALGQPIKSAVIAVMRSLVALVIGLLILPLIFGEAGIWLPLIFTEVMTLFLTIYYVKKYPYGFKKTLVNT